MVSLRSHRLGVADALHDGVGRHEPRGGRVGLVALLAVLLRRDLSDVREGNLHRLGLAGARFARDQDGLRELVAVHLSVGVLHQRVNVRRQVATYAALELRPDRFAVAAGVLERVDADYDVADIRVHDLRLPACRSGAHCGQQRL